MGEISSRLDYFFRLDFGLEAIALDLFQNSLLLQRYLRLCLYRRDLSRISLVLSLQVQTLLKDPTVVFLRIVVQCR